MSKALDALKYFKSAYNGFLKTTNDMFCQITISREQANEFVEEVEVVEKKVKALEIIKRFIWVEDGKLKCGRYADIEIELEEEDFESKEQFNLLKEVLE